MASIIQDSSIEPAAYAVTASDLRPVIQGNSMHKYADDTYLVVCASYHQSFSTEIDNLDSWFTKNNLAFNRNKSVEIVFVMPRSRRVVAIPPPAVPSLTCVDSIKALGLSITRTFSVTPYIENILASCAQSTFALRTLRNHGMLTKSLQTIFQATVVGKLSYASSAWWGFANHADCNRLESFLRCSERLGYRELAIKTLSEICELADASRTTRVICSTLYSTSAIEPVPTYSSHYRCK